MLGTDYISPSNPGRTYKHMRAMLNKLWDMTHNYTDRFEIDTRFKLDPDAISRHIFTTFLHNDVNEAHYKVCQDYKANKASGRRGRPKGAQNKSTIFGKGDQPPPVPFNDPMLPEVEESSEPVVTATEVMTFPLPTIDMSNYVTKPELARGLDQMGNTALEGAREYTRGYVGTVQEVLEAKIAAIEQHRPTIIEIKRPELPETTKLGVQHMRFPELLTMCQAGLANGEHLNIWIYGPAGTGKSTAHASLAKALDLKPYGSGKMATEYAVLGFMNTTGYQTTQFRQAYEFGGPFLADEIDGSAPDATLALNGALANGECVFPDRVVKRHPNFIFIAAANTTGTGATIDYVGRYKQDAAFNDRFVFLDWPLDEALEDNICPNKEWLARVRHVRANIQRVGIKGHLITPRASIYGSALLAAGLSLERVERSVLKKGLTDAQWSQVR